MTDLNKIDPNILQEYQKSYRPYYNYRADYQTDAPSYFDYLGNLNKIFTSIIDSINQQVDYVNAINEKDIKVEDTDTIKLLMEGDFKVDNQILLKGRLKISDNIENRQYQNKTFDIRNAIVTKDDGIYVRDYTEVIAFLSSLIEENKKIIQEYKQNIDNQFTENKKIVQNNKNEIDTIKNIIQEFKETTATKSSFELLESQVKTNKTESETLFSKFLKSQNQVLDMINTLDDRVKALESK